MMHQTSDFGCNAPAGLLSLPRLAQMHGDAARHSRSVFDKALAELLLGSSACE